MQKILAALAMLVFVAGLSLLAYPVVSNLYYEKQQKKLMDYYENIVVEELSKDEISDKFQACWQYNAGLLEGGILLSDPFDEKQMDYTLTQYSDLLNLEGDGVMGYITIPDIGVNLMIYHGVSEEVLQKGVGHLQGSSLPVGGKGAHSVLSAHTGLNNKKLFTDLDQLVEGDIFYITVLGEILAYQIDQIKVVLPHEVEDLKIEADNDYVTMVTCTPYGINTHRLLVRGIRIPYEDTQIVKNQATTKKSSRWFREYIYASITGIGFVLIFLIIVYFRKIRYKYIGRNK